MFGTGLRHDDPDGDHDRGRPGRLDHVLCVTQSFLRSDIMVLSDQLDHFLDRIHGLLSDYQASETSGVNQASETSGCMNLKPMIELQRL